MGCAAIACLMMVGCGDDDDGPTDTGMDMTDSSVMDDTGTATDTGTDTGPGTDTGGGDLCEGVDCSGESGPCSVGVCNPADGTCQMELVAEGTACDDGTACTTGDACSAFGDCVGETLDCSSIDDDCSVGACDPVEGCMPSPRDDGTECDDGSACTAGDVCTGGTCGGTETDCSDLTDMCMVGMCDPATGDCAAMPVADGTACDDGDMCTTGDACSAGVCSGMSSCRVPVDAFQTGVARNTTRRGGRGGDAFEDVCPEGEVLKQLEVVVSGFITRITGLCAEMNISGAADPRFSTGGASRLSPHGRGTGAATRRVCPTGQVIVGFGGRANLLIDQLVPQCAPVELAVAGDEYELEIGAASALEPVGGSGGSAFAVTSCPAGTVAAGVFGSAGDGLDSFGLVCRAIEPAYTVETAAPTTTTMVGNRTGGDLFEDACPGGMVVTGFTFAGSGPLTGAGPICREALVVGPLSAPSGITFSERFNASFFRGTRPGGSTRVECPAGEVVTGFGGRANRLVDQVALRCQQLGVDADGLTLSGGTSLTPFGGSGGSAFRMVSCPADQVATQSRVRVGDSLDAFALGCSPGM